MNGKITKLFGVVMALVLAVALSGVGVAYDTDSASAKPSVLKWTRIPIPDTGDSQLHPISDVGPIAVSPDGDTLFACVYNESGAKGYWYVNKSTDGGFTWVSTDLFNPNNGGDPRNADGDDQAFVDIVVSPDWGDFQYTAYAATKNSVYRTIDAGNNWAEMGEVPGTPDHPTQPGDDVITSLDVTMDSAGRSRLVVGTYGPDQPDVYMLLMGDWVAQDVWKGLDPAYTGINGTGSYNGLDGVLECAFPPYFEDEEMIFAVVNGRLPLKQAQTILRGENQLAEEDIDEGNWGTVTDCPFNHVDGVTEPIYAFPGVGRARIAFGDDFDGSGGSSSRHVIVGITAYRDITKANTDPDAFNNNDIAGNPASVFSRGDAFRCTPSIGFVGTTDPVDLDITPDGETNAWDLAVSGGGTSGSFLASLRELDTQGPLTSWQSTVHYSDNGGASWLQSYKPPSGALSMAAVMPILADCHVLMAPDFDSSGISYASTSGFFSGLWASTSFGTTYNGRGLLDYSLESEWQVNAMDYRVGEKGRITDMAVSPNYASDETIFMVTQGETTFPGAGDPVYPAALLWRTTDSGDTWEAILGMNALFPLPGIFMDKVEISNDYPADPTIAVTGVFDGTISDHCSMILMSLDDGDLFTTPVATDEFVVTAWDVVDSDTIIAGGWDLDDYFASMWWWDGNTYDWTEQPSAYPNQDNVSDIAVYGSSVLVGSRAGEVYICYDYRDLFEFEQVGSGPGIADPDAVADDIGDGVYVDFDRDYDGNDIIYAALNSSSSGGDGEVYKFDLGASVWEQISDLTEQGWPENMNVLGLDCAEDGTVYTLDAIYPTTPLNPPPPLYAGHGIGWRTANVLETPVNLGTRPLWEEMDNGLGTNNGSVLRDLEVVGGGSNYVFAIGKYESDNINDIYRWTIWGFYDTLTAGRGEGPVDLLFPLDGSTGVGTPLTDDPGTVSIVLQWKEAEGAEWYEWEIATDEEFTNKVAYHAFFRESGGTAVEQITDGELLQGYLPVGRTFYWHVKVFVPYLSEWSETWSFDTLPGSGAPRPICISPTGGITDVGRKPVLAWTNVIDADSYELILVKNCEWTSSPVVDKTGSNALGAETAYQVPTQLDWGTNYCWKVRALSGDAVSTWSDAGSFTTEEQPVVEPEEGTPFWVWLVIGIAAILLIAVIALIVLTKRT